MMLDVVFVIVFARSNQTKFGVRLRCWKEANFARCVAGDGEEKKSAAAGAFNVEAETFVRLFVEQRVGLGCTEDVAIEAVRALGSFVFDGAEERAVVGGPGGASYALDSNGKRLASVQIFDL